MTPALLSPLILICGGNVNVEFNKYVPFGKYISPPEGQAFIAFCIDAASFVAPLPIAP